MERQLGPATPMEAFPARRRLRSDEEEQQDVTDQRHVGVDLALGAGCGAGSPSRRTEGGKENVAPGPKKLVAPVALGFASAGDR